MISNLLFIIEIEIGDILCLRFISAPRFSAIKTPFLLSKKNRYYKKIIFNFSKFCKVFLSFIFIEFINLFKVSLLF